MLNIDAMEYSDVALAAAEDSYKHEQANDPNSLKGQIKAES